MTVRVAFLGAGGVNFGGHGNAWDHATRLELLPSVEFVGIADLNVEQAERVLALRKKKATSGHRWQQCQIFQDYKEMLQLAAPHCVFIGVPPGAHGSSERPIELVCARAGVHMFIEKPLSCAPANDIQGYAQELSELSKNLVISVAYMFRYSDAIRKMRDLATEFGPVKLFQARYHCAYEKIGAFWFDVSQSGGPIVEQATHFLDLGRYFCGDVDIGSVMGMSIKSTDAMGVLSKLKVDESRVQPANRVPRVTHAMWKFKSGAMGTLCHSALLHGWAYETQLEIVGDGYQIVLKDPYGKCEMYVRSPTSDAGEVLNLQAGNDPYLEEIQTFIEACRTGDKSKIASPYEDAVKTYLLSWAVRSASE
jgi:predicted dehydrogenase